MRWPKRLRMPSFRTAYLGSLALLLVMVVWYFIDDELYTAFFALKMSFSVGRLLVRLGSFSLTTFLFGALSVLALLSILAVCYRLVFGDSRGRSLRALMLTIVLIGLWLTFILSREKIDHASCLWRVHRSLPGLKEDAAILLAHWPTTDGVLPFFGEYAMGSIDKESTAVFHRGNSEPGFCGDIILFIQEIEDGGIRLDLDVRRQSKTVEYRPDDSKPASFTRTWDDGILVAHNFDKYIELEPHWFLVWYSEDSRDVGFPNPENENPNP
jgi:hypothetical protein